MEQTINKGTFFTHFENQLNFKQSADNFPKQTIIGNKQVTLFQTKNICRRIKKTKSIKIIKNVNSAIFRDKYIF